jgi:hypothetical protein
VPLCPILLLPPQSPVLFHRLVPPHDLLRIEISKFSDNQSVKVSPSESFANFGVHKGEKSCLLIPGTSTPIHRTTQGVPRGAVSRLESARQRATLTRAIAPWSKNGVEGARKSDTGTHHCSVVQKWRRLRHSIAPRPDFIDALWEPHAAFAPRKMLERRGEPRCARTPIIARNRGVVVPLPNAVKCVALGDAVSEKRIGD